MLQNQGFQYRKLIIIIYTGFEHPIPPTQVPTKKGKIKESDFIKFFASEKKKKKEKVK